ILPQRNGVIPTIIVSANGDRTEAAAVADTGENIAEGTYTVKRGDTISTIASRYRIPTATLLARNNMRSGNLIRPGQVLKLGAEGTNQSAPAERNVAAQLHETLEAREQLAVATLQTASTQQPVTVSQIASVASTQQAVASTTLVPLKAEFDPSRLKVAADNTIDILEDETLGHYAGWLGISSAELRRLNNMSAKASVQTGKRLKLDFANVDVKTLLDERNTLELLRKSAIVEIGQKRKRLEEIDGRLKLVDAKLEPWFETYVSEKPVPLYCTIGSFTQPGFKANRVLIEEVSRIIGNTKARKAAEFGSGVGNFTLPIANQVEHLTAYEVDDLALDGLRRSLTERSIEHKVTINSGNYQGTKAESISFEGVDLLFVDPPRSGLMKFLDPLEKMQAVTRPRSIVYVSCFGESFASDAKRLIEMGYGLKELAIVDQFPQSRHYEVVSSFTRD
ncbi:MAG: LysM peptidoglycan-binding domain-containing protein, partial [Bdellovibrionota bacterium]